MNGFVSKNTFEDVFFDEDAFRQLAIDLSNESIANLRSELDILKDK